MIYFWHFCFMFFSSQSRNQEPKTLKMERDPELPKRSGSLHHCLFIVNKKTLNRKTTQLGHLFALANLCLVALLNVLHVTSSDFLFSKKQDNELLPISLSVSVSSISSSSSSSSSSSAGALLATTIRLWIQSTIHSYLLKYKFWYLMLQIVTLLIKKNKCRSGSNYFPQWSSGSW